MVAYSKQYSKYTKPKATKRLLPSSDYKFHTQSMYFFLHNMGEFHWNLFVCYTSFEEEVIWTVFNSLTSEGVPTHQDHGNSLIVKGAPVLSAIMFYFLLLQGKTALKPPQKFTFQAGITAHQPDKINCGYFAVVAVQQIMEFLPPLTDLVLVNENRDTLAHYTKCDIIKTFK